MSADPGPLALVRADLRGFAGYASARNGDVSGDCWLNANEASSPSPVDRSGQLRRYPQPQSARLRARMADVYGCTPEQVLPGRGSDEGIDLLVRATCRPGADAIVTCPPTFGMYAVSARLHGTRVVEVPLLEDAAAGFACDFEAVAWAAVEQGAKLVFLCSPGNPAGNLLPLEAIDALAGRLEGLALVVVDEAYVEYAGADSAVSLLPRRRNVVVLRTLSKAHALAAARVGCVIADAALVPVLGRCQAPYPLPAASEEVAFAALAANPLRATRAGVEQVLGERERMAAALEGTPGVRKVFPSHANFLLVRFDDAQRAWERLLAAGVVVRDQRAVPGLGDALRISIGLPRQNDRVLRALLPREQAA